MSGAAEIVAGLALFAAVVGCAPRDAAPVPPPPAPGRVAWDASDLVRYEDAARRVTCYRVAGRDGLWCYRDSPAARLEQ